MIRPGQIFVITRPPPPSTRDRDPLGVRARFERRLDERLREVVSANNLLQHSQAFYIAGSGVERALWALGSGQEQWHQPLRRSASESGQFCHGDGGPERGDRRRRGLMLATLPLAGRPVMDDPSASFS